MLGIRLAINFKIPNNPKNIYYNLTKIHSSQKILESILKIVVACPIRKMVDIHEMRLLSTIGVFVLANS